jgi:ParB/RepB/Spo0J family partition protein
MKSNTLKLIPLAHLVRSEVNPRLVNEDDPSVEELAASIRAHGLLQPLRVRPAGRQSWTIIAGHRRHVAAGLAGLDAVPCVVETTEQAETPAEVLHLVENLQRVDLTGAQTALAVFAVIKSKTVKQKALSAQLGKSEAWVSKAKKVGEYLTGLERTDRPMFEAYLGAEEPLTLDYLYDHATMAERRAEEFRLYKEAEARREAEAAASAQAQRAAQIADDADQDEAPELDDETEEGDAGRQVSFVGESSDQQPATLDDAERALRWMQIDRMRAMVGLLPDEPLQGVFFDHFDHLTAIRDEKTEALEKARREFEAVRKQRDQELDGMRSRILARWTPAAVMAAYYAARKAEEAGRG